VTRFLNAAAVAAYLLMLAAGMYLFVTVTT
jgi:hypothetical protein